jgi:putative transposase
MATVEHAGCEVLRRGLEGEALDKYGKPKIFNTDQSAQFTSAAFTDVLRDADIKISLGDRGCCLDNIFIKRLWRSLKYEAVYLHEMADGFVAERVIGNWIKFYNTEHPHSSLDDRTSREAYWQKRRPLDMGTSPAGLTTSPA